MQIQMDTTIKTTFAFQPWSSNVLLIQRDGLKGSERTYCFTCPERGGFVFMHTLTGGLEPIYVNFAGRGFLLKVQNRSELMEAVQGAYAGALAARKTSAEASK